MSVVEDVFGLGGLMAQQFPGYEPRKQQVSLSKAIFETMASGDRLMASAPTGCGKSVSYLVPAIWYATEGAQEILEWRKTVDSSELGFDEDEESPALPDEEPVRILVATANIALQEQLIQKDLPQLAKILPWPFTYGIAKGRGNYLCRREFENSIDEVNTKGLKDQDDRIHWNEIAKWQATTPTGDLSELAFEPSSRVRSLVTTTTDDCTGRACRKYKECFAEKAKKAVRSAQVVVTNQHLLCAHFALMSEFGKGCLPRFDILVVDEAHALSSISRSFFGFQVTPGAFKWATRFLASPPNDSVKGGTNGYDLDADLALKIRQGAESLFEELKDIKASPRYKARMKEPIRDACGWPQLVSDLHTAVDVYDKSGSMGLELGILPERQAELRKAARRCKILSQYLVAACTGKDKNFVYYVEQTDKRIALCAQPIDVADMLRQRIWEVPGIRSVIATSATIAVGSGKDAFSYMVKETGARSVDEMIVTSPFDHESNMLIVVPTKIPDPKHADWSREAASYASKAVELARGRTLILCTSNANLRVMSERIKFDHGQRYKVLTQGEMPRTRIVDEFRKDTSSVLIGTRSLFEGIDVQGESLSCVVIDKLPFDHPMDPIVDAITSSDPNAFNDWSIPRCSIVLAQAAGRLIRSKTDRGCILILDRRLTVAPWARKILRSLPPARVTASIDEIGKFFAEE